MNQFMLSNKTSTCDGSSWDQLESDRKPSKRYQPAMGYDALVLFGGVSEAGLASGTWVWDGTTWTQEVLRRSPKARWEHVTATFGERLVLFGGDRGNRTPTATWILKSDSWRRRPLTESPGPRPGALFAWDPVRAEVVLFGGWKGPYVDETWALSR